MLDEFGFGGLGIAKGDLLASGRVVQLGLPPNRIDILTSISGVEFDAAWNSRVDAILDGQHVNVLGHEQLLMNKQAAGRAKDLADVAKLIAIEKRDSAG